jgi:hypothetical protein
MCGFQNKKVLKKTLKKDMKLTFDDFPTLMINFFVPTHLVYIALLTKKLKLNKILMTLSTQLKFLMTLTNFQYAVS